MKNLDKTKTTWDLEVEEAVRDAVDMDQFCESLLGVLGFEVKSEVHGSVLIGMLKEELRAVIEPLVLRNLDQGQMELLEEFISSSPESARGDAAVAFALMRPGLKRKVFDDMSEYLTEFVERMRALNF